MTQSDMSLFSAMQDGEPYAQYQKTILAKIYVTVLNPFKPGEYEGILLEGAPGSENSIVKVWSVAEDVFFKRMNKRHFQKGNIIPYQQKAQPVQPAEPTIEQMSDDDLRKVVNSRFMALQNTLNKINSTAPLYRLINLATEEEKSQKIIDAIKARLSEIQQLEYKAPTE